jgi:hypothetical protein
VEVLEVMDSRENVRELRPPTTVSLRRDAAVPRIGSAGKVGELQAVLTLLSATVTGPPPFEPS